MKLKLMLFAAMLLCYVGLFAAGEEEEIICQNETGTHDGYYYMHWLDSGEACMTLKAGGTFSCEWNSVGNFMSQKGELFGLAPLLEVGTITLDYACTYYTNGGANVGVFGMFTDPIVEYYIVDSWGTTKPPGGQGYVDTITVDGCAYDIFKTIRYDVGIGMNAVLQYWSVRTSKRTNGTISVSEHFNAWQNRGLSLGKLYNVTFSVEGYQSSGMAEVYHMVLHVGDDDDDDDEYTEISAPFEHNGTGSLKWKRSTVPNYICSWCLDSLTINGVDFTNIWVSESSLPAKQDGYYYIDCEASYSWSHVEII